MRKLIQGQPALTEIKEERRRLVRLTVIWILSFVVMTGAFILAARAVPGGRCSWGQQSLVYFILRIGNWL